MNTKKTIIKKTPYIVIEGGSQRIRAEYGLRYLEGNYTSYFSLTGEIQRNEGGYWKEYSFGCIHEEISKYFPELSIYERWHCMGWDGPMHYAANASFWWFLYLQASGKIPPYESTSFLDTKVWGVDPKFTSEQLLSYFKHTTVFGVLSDDELPNFQIAYRTHRVGGEVKELPVYDPKKECEGHIKKWCEDRLPRLKELFKINMVQLLGEEVLRDEETQTA
jgi:hypothetical protein